MLLFYTPEHSIMFDAITGLALYHNTGIALSTIEQKHFQGDLIYIGKPLTLTEKEHLQTLYDSVTTYSPLTYKTQENASQGYFGNPLLLIAQQYGWDLSPFIEECSHLHNDHELSYFLQQYHNQPSFFARAHHDSLEDPMLLEKYTDYGRVLKENIVDRVSELIHHASPINVAGYFGYMINAHAYEAPFFFQQEHDGQFFIVFHIQDNYVHLMMHTKMGVDYKDLWPSDWLPSFKERKNIAHAVLPIKDFYAHVYLN